MTVHPRARAGFAAAAENYERGRPGYPEAALDWLWRELELSPGSRVVDLGAGTGKLTRGLLARGARVTAVEPVAEMGAILQRMLPEAELAPTSADETGLADGSADAVTAGQSLHWFADPGSLAEIHRILRPGAGLGLIWNRRQTTDPTWARVETLIGPLRKGAPSHQDGSWRQQLESSGLFSSLEEAVFEHSQELTSDLLVDRVASTSSVGALPPAERRGLVRRLEGLARQATGPGGTLSLPYRTEAWVCRAVV